MHSTEALVYCGEDIHNVSQQYLITVMRALLVWHIAFRLHSTHIIRMLLIRMNRVIVSCILRLYRRRIRPSCIHVSAGLCQQTVSCIISGG